LFYSVITIPDDNKILFNAPIYIKMFRRNKLLLLITVILFILSCEYELEKENFVEIEPPPDSRIFNLDLIPSDDTIVILNTTSFQYNFNTYGLTIYEAGFSLGDKKWIFHSEGSGIITINPAELDAGIDTLTMYIRTNSGTGSIADIAGAEGYFAERKWLVKTDGRSAPAISLTQSITEDGFLKISWPKCEQYNFHSYELEYIAMGGPPTSKIITDPDSTCFIDSCFVGGDAYYTVSTRVVTNNQFTRGNTYKVSEPVPELKFENIGLDSLRVFWNSSKYRCTYTLSRIDVYPNITLSDNLTDTTFTIEHPGFGRRSEFMLTTSPVNLNESNSHYSKTDYEYHALGKNIAGNWPEYGYNHLDKVVYTNTYDDMECFDIVNLDLINSVNLHNLIYQGMHSCPTNSTKVATISSENIYVFADKSLQDPVVIPYNSWGTTIDHLCLTDNNVITVVHPKKLSLVSVEEKKVVAAVDIEDYPEASKWACLTTSADGKHFCVVTYNGIKIHSLENGNISQIYSENRAYRSAMFNVNDPGELFITYNDNSNLEIRSVPGYSLIRTIQLPTGAQVLRNIDPESGLLLLTDYDYLYIVDINTSQVVLKVRCNEERRAKLYGNRLFSTYGYSMDISEYLPK